MLLKAIHETSPHKPMSLVRDMFSVNAATCLDLGIAITGFRMMPITLTFADPN